MQIKKYIAQSLQEAATQMKDELGGEAVILSTRIKEVATPKGKIKMFELIAGIEDDFDKNKQPVKTENKIEPKVKVVGDTYKNELNNLNQRIYNKYNIPEKVKVTKQNLDVAVSKDVNIENDLKKLVELLLHKEVSKQNINKILDQLKQYKKVLHSSNIESYLLSCLSSMINTYNFELKKRNKPYIVSLVGPTGVGKTTCIAKLAVISKILHNLDVGLISVDTYRLGAIDQLKIFSEIAGIDMLVAYEPKEMPQLVNNFKKKDIIFIDTAGRSQKNAEQLQKNLSFFTEIKPDETFLVLSSIVSLRTMYDIVDKFSVFKYKSVILTKIDEAPAFGNILNLSAGKNVPISFLSNGQVIPDDIISADADFIANMIYSGKTTK